MGFAGQVFAARVAVGLAMPSPKAFNAAGALVGGFASKMYSQLNQKSVQAAKANVNNATKSLAKAKARLAAHSASSKKQLDDSAKAAVNSLTQSYGKLGKTAVMSSGAMKGLKAKLGKPTRVKLFSGLSKDLKDAGDYKKMMENFIKLNREERMEVLRGINVRKNALKQKVVLGQTSGKISKDDIENTKSEIKILDLQTKEYGDYHAERTAHDRKYNAKTKKYSQDVQKGLVKERIARKELTDAQKSQLLVQTRLTAAAHAFASELKTNFVDSVRESVSILTAFYYKLNQNTQELINFERELLNANSVFRVTNDELFSVGDTVVQFGQEFGLEMQNGAEGLYQLASAGLSASESMQVLTETLKLSMAVQGDHNTISKLVTQTLFGFDMEMSQAAEVTDKFAFAIQKSLIEYQDLASAVKFALPFFTSTGQSIDQLLGALQILTNRALEAGIAGRGLRQGLAELAESIGDSTARFREYGIEVTDAQGNMLKLTEIAANFSDVLEAGVINDTELLTTLIEDLNVRGATAFVHLVQASDEFTQAVEDTKNAGGELDKMVRIQNESIGAQIQILKNNVAMMFMYRDASFEGTLYLNAFHQAIVQAVASLRNMLVVERDGTAQLTEFGLAIQEVAITGVQEMQKIMGSALPVLEKFVQLGALGVEIFKIYLIPVKVLIKALDTLGPTFVKFVLGFHILNKLLPISTLLQYSYFLSTLRGVTVTQKQTAATMKSTIASQGYSSALMTKLFWQKLTAFWIVTDTALTDVNTASTVKASSAELYSRGLKIIGLGVSKAEQANMTREIFLKRLKSEGIVLESGLISGLHAKKTVGIMLDQLAIKGEERMIYTRGSLVPITWSATWATDANSKAEAANSGAKLTGIFATIKSGLTRVWNTIFLTGETTAIYGNTQAVNLGTWTRLAYVASLFATMWATLKDTTMIIVNSVVKQWNTLMTSLQAIAEWAKNSPMYAGYVILLLVAIPMIVYTVVTMALTIASWLLAAPLAVIGATLAFIFSPVIALVIGVGLLIGVFYVLGREINKQIDVMFYLKQMVMGIGNMFVWLGKAMIAPFIWVGEAVVGLIDNHLFTFILFLKHFWGMIMYYFKALVDYIGFGAGSSLLSVLTAPFTAVWNVIKDVIGVLYTNEDSLFNKIVAFVDYIVNESFLAPIFDAAKLAIDLVKDALIGVWDYLSTTFTADNIKNTMGSVSEAISGLLMAPIDAFKTMWNSLATLMMSITIPLKIDGFEIALPDWAGGAGFKWAGIDESMTFGDWPKFDIEAMAQGGYINPMAQGGYFVGERGPELFLPSSSGQIIPNKDLNTQRVKSMLADAFDTAPRAGAAANVNRVMTLQVENLEAVSAKMNKTRMGVDTFA